MPRRLLAVSVVATLLGSAVTAPANAILPAVRDPGVGCAAATVGFTPVLQLTLPERAGWLDKELPYTLDRRTEVGSNFDRVGYCLELNGPDGPQRVWTAMEPFSKDARNIGLPTKAGQVTRQRVDDLEVASNVPNVTTGLGQTGYLEMWPNTYAEQTSTQVANTSPITYDVDDSPTNGAYGSFQVSQVGATRPSGAAAKTVLAINSFTQPADVPLSIGIGTSPSGQPDWTFAGNAPRLTQRKLTAYVRTSLVSLSEAPQDRQLIPRDAANGANVPVAGRITSSNVSEVRLRVTSNGHTDTYSSQARDFRFTPRINAALQEYTFELRAVGGGTERVVARRTGVVSGDVYVIQGQSNAEAAKFNGAANAEESPWLRSYGTPTSDGQISGADRVWHYATGDVTVQSGSVGQWAIRMGRRIVDTYRVPVAIVQGAHGGQPISFFQRNDENPDDLTTNYGRLRTRLKAAGLISQVRGVLWYQGESDNDNAAVHVAGFRALLADWRADFGSATRYYVNQVRTSPCNNTTNINLREAQRALGDTDGVVLLSTNGLPGHDGCHYAYLGGYRDLGDQNFAVIARDLYGGPSAGVSAPNPASVTASGSQLVVKLRTADPLTVAAGSAADFRVQGSTVTVSSVAYQAGGSLVLTLSGPATGVTALIYQSHNGSGPAITNATGTGLLAFRMPVS
ncbi:hypothetical protein GCM10009745_23570 [Kribbella yunnanensis]|uniref:Sialate O-acetylesterase domain-containing protein n=1 Tax=Kribbella yunnanensis TaxID=190194 RepID=A0ABN2GYT5_9ACTN